MPPRKYTIQDRGEKLSRDRRTTYEDERTGLIASEPELTGEKFFPGGNLGIMYATAGREEPGHAAHLVGGGMFREQAKKEIANENAGVPAREGPIARMLRRVRGGSGEKAR